MPRIRRSALKSNADFCVFLEFNSINGIGQQIVKWALFNDNPVTIQCLIRDITAKLLVLEDSTYQGHV